MHATYLIIHIADVLLALPVHVQNFQESFVDSLISGKACLQQMQTGQTGNIDTDQSNTVFALGCEFSLLLP